MRLLLFLAYDNWSYAQEFGLRAYTELPDDQYLAVRFWRVVGLNLFVGYPYPYNNTTSSNSNKHCLSIIFHPPHPPPSLKVKGHSSPSLDVQVTKLDVN